MAERLRARLLRGALAIILFTECVVPAPGQPTVGVAVDDALRATLLGTWKTEIGGERIEIEFLADGSYRLQEARGTFTVGGGTLALSEEPASTYRVALSGKDSLTLSGGDLASPSTFSRIVTAASAVRNALRFDVSRLAEKLTAIAMIVAIVIASRLVLWVFKVLSHFLIFSERGPLKYLYRSNKNRTRTLHALLLDLLKYVVYFTAIGFMLSEIGVNYTAYLASLSVIGLAVGFGSQGLVQDVVTGFFLVIEGQFNVGDMVDISGQVGLVDDMGLRMTQIRNYVGQIVYIPNRNIAVAGRYTAGALAGFVEIRPPAEAPLSQLVEAVTSELQKEFSDVFLRDDCTIDTVALGPGIEVLRCHFAIWPGQTWIIDQQLVPRVRTRAEKAGMPLDPTDIAVCYHVEQVRETGRRKGALRRLRRRIVRPGREDHDNL